jgi:hypothetical protein
MLLFPTRPKGGVRLDLGYLVVSTLRVGFFTLSRL